MRFMILVKADRNSEAGAMPSRQLVEAMGRFNEAMVKAGVLLAGDGLHPTSRGARVRFQGRRRVVSHGPFQPTPDLLAGFWIIQVKSREEAIEWASRVPFTDDEEIEIRQVFEAADFAPESLTAEALAREEALRARLQGDLRH